MVQDVLMRRAVAIGAALGAVAAACWLLWSAREAPKISERSAHSTIASRSPERLPKATIEHAPTPTLTRTSLELSAARAAALPDERALMSTLRALGDSEPERSLQLAREAERRFPDSPDAPERTWYICKSLVNLERFYDAREEARLMVAAYPGTPWTEDVARHLLVNPLDLPGDPAPESAMPSQ